MHLIREPTLWERFRKKPLIYHAESVADYLENQAPIVKIMENWQNEDMKNAWQLFEKTFKQKDALSQRIILLYNVGITALRLTPSDWVSYNVHDATGEKMMVWGNYGLWVRAWQTPEEARAEGLTDDDWMYRVIFRDYAGIGMPHILAVEKRRSARPEEKEELFGFRIPSYTLP